MDAKLRHKPSYACHRIFASHILVKDGILWGIDDNSINIWSQPWVPASARPYITSSTPLGLEDLKVSPLINHQQQCWHQVVVQQISNDNDQRNVASHPLLNNEVDDKIIWRLTANGEYNIKSSYHNVMETMMQSYPARALDGRLQEDWARGAREGRRVLVNLRVDFGPIG